jgi:hypothetical protein
MPRFVLLYHECPADYARPSHWDLMLEAGNSLRTWALLELPRGCEAARASTATIYPECANVSPESNVDTESLGNHRRDYLEYEGPVSGERGHVTRVDAGSFETIEESGQRWRVKLRGERVVGQITLAKGNTDANLWTLSWNGSD